MRCNCSLLEIFIGGNNTRTMLLRPKTAKVWLRAGLIALLTLSTLAPLNAAPDVDRLAEAEFLLAASPGRHQRQHPDAALLADADPFVRGLAEWAMASRLNDTYECAEQRVDGRRVYTPWPGEESEAPDWFKGWDALGAEAMLEQDYVRQAYGLGWHKDAAALLESAGVLMARAQATAADHVRRAKGDAAQLAEVAAALSAATAAHAKLLEAAHASELAQLRRLWLDLRFAVRKVALANPDINFDSLIFATRNATPGPGNITNGRWNPYTPGGDILIKTGLNPEDPVRPLLEGRLGPGHLRGLELHWDAGRAVFAFTRQPTPDSPEPQLRPKSSIGGYFGFGIGETEFMPDLYEVNVDGSGLRQLTDDPFHSDQEPTYLPNGDIVFVSDRSWFGSQCAGAMEQDNMILNLYRCDPDGGSIRALSNNKDFDRHPHMMDDGSILFLRWEYQERHLWNTHTLWTARPDGTMTDAFYKQHIDHSPMSLREARQAHGTHTVAAIACGHHNWDQGAVFLVNSTKGTNNADAMRNLTPGVYLTEGGYGPVKAVEQGGVQDAGGHYMFPFPLSETAVLAAYSYRIPEWESGRNFALYYLDAFGNKELIHREKRLSVAYLSPLRPTPCPPVLRELDSPTPASGEAASPVFATVTVADVYRGWPDSERGSVKYLRVAQKVPWPCVEDEDKSCGFNDLHWMPAAWAPVLGNWDWAPARVIGIVPVDPDGSAHFRVPADQPVYLQALDANLLEVRRMRSNFTLKAGEMRSCVGCHESQQVSPPAPRSTMPMAMQRPASVPVPPAWGDRVIPDYVKHIQPIFDRACVSCHGPDKPKGGIDLSSHLVDGYVQSYRTLFGLQADEPTPMHGAYKEVWLPGSPKATEAENKAAQAFREQVLRNPPEDQLVRISDFMGGSGVTRIRQFGSAVSPLTRTLITDKLHRAKARLTADEWTALVTWLHLNAPYWGTFVEKDGHYASREGAASTEAIIPARRVWVEFPDPWQQPPAGRWIWKNEDTAVLEQ